MAPGRIDLKADEEDGMGIHISWTLGPIHLRLWRSVTLFSRTKVQKACHPDVGVGHGRGLTFLLLCSHSPNDVPPRTSAERIHSRGTGRRASVHTFVM